MRVPHTIFMQTQDEIDSVIGFISSVRALERLGDFSCMEGAKIRRGISRILQLCRKREHGGARSRWPVADTLVQPRTCLDQEKEAALIDFLSAIRALERLGKISVIGQVEIRRGVTRLHRLLRPYPLIIAA